MSNKFDTATDEEYLTEMSRLATVAGGYTPEVAKHCDRLLAIANQLRVAETWRQVAVAQNSKLMAMCDAPDGIEKLSRVLKEARGEPVAKFIDANQGLETFPLWAKTDADYAGEFDTYSLYKNEK